MALIEWKDEFATGIAALDHEHREMIGLINQLHDQLAKTGAKGAVTDFLGEIFARISAHFALEETIMREAAYAEYEDHKADHEHLLEEIRDIMDSHDRDAYFEYESILADQLRVWFADHFRTKDARLHRIMS